MHKIRLIALGLAVFILCGCNSKTTSTEKPSEQSKLSVPVSADPLTFPYTMSDSPLVAEKLICYQGAFWEDGSGEKVEDIAGLLLYNPTDRLVEYAALAVEQEDETLYFFIHHLPPHSRCLVLEKNRHPWVSETFSQCRELGIRWSWQELSGKEIDYVGLGTTVTLVNREDRILTDVKIWYKHYDHIKGYYLGGAVFSAHLPQLLPQEERALHPGNYHSTNSRIVGIQLKM